MPLINSSACVNIIKIYYNVERILSGLITSRGPVPRPGIMIKSGNAPANENTIRLWTLCKAFIDTADDTSTDSTIAMKALTDYLSIYQTLDPKPDLNATLEFSSDLKSSHDDKIYSGTTVLWCITYLANTKEEKLPLANVINIWDKLDPMPKVNAAPTHDDSPNKGTSICWLACTLTWHNDPTLLNYIMSSWVKLNPKPDVNAGPNNESNLHNGESVYFYACCLSRIGKPAFLNHLIARWSRLYPKPDLNACPITRDSRNADISIFLSACLLARDDNNHELLNHIIEIWDWLDIKPNVNTYARRPQSTLNGISTFWLACFLASNGKPALLRCLIDHWEELDPTPDFRLKPLHDASPMTGKTVFDIILTLDQALQIPLLEKATRHWSTIQPCVALIDEKKRAALAITPIENLIHYLGNFEVKREETQSPTTILKTFNKTELVNYQVSAFQLVRDFFKTEDLDYHIELLSHFPIDSHPTAPHFALEMMKLSELTENDEAARFYAIAGYLVTESPKLKATCLENLIRFTYLTCKPKPVAAYKDFKALVRIDKLLESNSMIKESVSRLAGKIESKITRHLISHRQDLSRAQCILESTESSTTVFAAVTSSQRAGAGGPKPGTIEPSSE